MNCPEEDLKQRVNLLLLGRPDVEQQLATASKSSQMLVTNLEIASLVHRRRRIPLPSLWHAFQYRSKREKDFARWSRGGIFSSTDHFSQDRGKSAANYDIKSENL